MEAQPTTKETPWERSVRYDVVVFGMVILTLIVGWIMRLLVEGDRTKFSDPVIQLSIQYPASWTTQKEKGRLLSVRNLRAEGTFKAGFWLEVKDYPAEAIKQVQELVASFSVERGKQLTGYRVLSVGGSQIGYEEAVEIEYAYVDVPKGAAMQSSLPVVVRAVAILFLYQDNLYILTFVAPADTFQAQSGIFNEIRSSVILGP